jgi:proteasome assembly chaperone (PAC2) family protein
MAYAGNTDLIIVTGASQRHSPLAENELCRKGLELVM